MGMVWTSSERSSAARVSGTRVSGRTEGRDISEGGGTEAEPRLSIVFAKMAQASSGASSPRAWSAREAVVPTRSMKLRMLVEGGGRGGGRCIVGRRPFARGGCRTRGRLRVGEEGGVERTMV